MLFKPASRIFRALLIVSTVAVVICYSWLAARLLEPRFSTPAFVSESFVRMTDGHVFLFDEKARQFSREAERIESELTTLEPLLNWLGPLRQPIEILVDEKDQGRLLVTDTRVEIGGEVALAQGQITKAVLKSWLLQHASPTITASQLRVEVASDVLLAMLMGRLSLEVPGIEEPISFDENVKTWFSYADSYAGVCASPWRLLELAPLCKSPASQTISSLSFRPFLGSLIWKSYMSLPFGERLPFIHRWTASLAESRFVSVPSLKDGWRAVIEGELETILPSSLDPLAESRMSWPSVVEAPLIVIDQSGEVKAPGTLRFISPELPVARARMAMMTECTPPTIDELTTVRVPVERIVWKPECEARRSDFIQVRPSALKIALSRGLTTRDMKLDDFVLKNSQSAWMGLADAQWDERLNAYHVRGAIQAVELFRLGTRDTDSGATTSAAPAPSQTL